MKRIIGVLLATVAGLPAPAQDDAALRDRVGGLVARLGAADEAERDGAEEALTALADRALALLPTEAPAGADDDAKARLARVRKAAEEAQEKASLGAARVTLRGEGVRLSEALRELQRQTGNRITDLREVLGGEATNPGLDLDLEDVPFYEALDRVGQLAGFEPEFFTGDGSIGIKPGAPDLPQMIGVDPPPVDAVRQYAGPFRVEFLRIGATREIASGEGRASVQFNVAWEPRLRPMLLALRADGVEIVDDRGEVVPPDVSDESTSVVLRPENPTVEVNLNLQAPDRGARSLRSLKVRGDVTAPAGLRRFKFPDLTKTPQVVEQGEVKLTLRSTALDENVWRIRVELAMPSEGAAFESYQQGLFNNQIWLEKADGARFEQNGGFNIVNAAPGRLAFEYLFVDVPGRPEQYTLAYETPSRVVTIPLEFEFRDVPLP